MKNAGIWVALGAILAVVCAPFQGAVAQALTVESETIESKALAINRLGDPSARDIKVVLPPSYPSSGKRYPVVYFLHGHNAPVDQFLRVLPAVERAMTSGASAEFIIVCANGSTRFGGGFFVNSPVAGNFEDFVVGETVAMVDAKYRTVAAARARAIAGFSMGGFGAVNLGLRHPDVFSVVYAVEPGLFAPDGLGKALKTWNGRMMDAYGTTFDPKPELPDPHRGNITEADIGSGNAAETAWNSGFGDLKAKIARYLSQPVRLTALHLDYGLNSQYGWIPEGTLHFSDLLKEAGIAHTINGHPIKHQLSADVVERSMLPFLTGALSAN